jgi:hypothetical protein
MTNPGVFAGAVQVLPEVTGQAWMSGRSGCPWNPRLIKAAMSIARTTKPLTIAARTTG